MSSKQHLCFCLLLIGALILSIPLFSHEQLLGFSWLCGISMGYVLQRSNFCFASAFRDLFLFRDTQMFKALLLLLALTLPGFWLVQYRAVLLFEEIPGKIYPLTLGTAAGGLFFGLGMVLAGACACGALIRLGEGFNHFCLVLAGLIAGSVAGSWHYGWWQRFLHQGAVFLPHNLGWGGALLLQLSVLLLLYSGLKIIEQKYTKKA